MPSAQTKIIAPAHAAFGVRLRLATALAAALLIVLHAAPSTVHASATAHISPGVIVEGQQALLEVEAPRNRIANQPDVPVVEGATVTIQSYARATRHGVETIRFAFIVTPERTGTLSIPPIPIGDPPGAMSSPPLTLEVRPLADLGDPPAENRRAHAVILPARDDPWSGQRIQAQVLVLADPSLSIRQVSHPDLPRQNLAAERFEGPLSLDLNWAGRRWRAFAFTSSITPLASGKIDLGPAETTLTVLTSEETPGSPFRRTRQIELPLRTTPRTLDVKPLPPGAPQGFDGIVGDYQIDARFSPPPLAPGDPIPIRITVRGTGDASQLSSPPTIASAHSADWEIIPDRRPEIRKDSLSNAVEAEFQLILRAKTPGLEEIPPFHLPHFNPDTESYQLAATEILPLDFATDVARPTVPDSTPTPLTPDTPPQPSGPATSPGPSAGPPTGIIRIPASRPDTRAPGTHPIALIPAIHTTGALLTASLLAIGFWRRYTLSPRGRHRAWKHQMRADLRKASRISDPVARLLALVRWTEKWAASPHALPCPPREAATIRELKTALATCRYAPDPQPPKKIAARLSSLLAHSAPIQNLPKMQRNP